MADQMANQGPWHGRAGQPNGAQYQSRFDRDASYPRGHGSTAVGAAVHCGAAGAASGSRYEVVHRDKSSPFVASAPFANNSEHWRKSTEHFVGPDAHRDGNLTTKEMHQRDAELFEKQRLPESSRR
mmetsp:Transcript_70831/g.153838  ORF Transcript_70831/g.153838 Transcript_70831/m.153838 type:complete len:126 (+) Transcript_70831:103-480(+)|eukprot:CAMPEP_0170618956 /NCGR_PEP_ID=MMETSP0224-20130122/27250_1 /TAXON_ID=285029 /ORGANISM="Togula jolla, Strain CCCM 725" /LENGTH=125 /DNA_ID=CAMNT_0010944995 /DNA_START=91 /DNA_END=468 /DNA_ORIENTATION=-